MSKKKIICIVGTRPEAIKMAPVIESLRETCWADVSVLVTGQHRELLDQALSIFDLSRDRDLRVMTDGQSLSALSGNLFISLEKEFIELKPDLVIAQGDTTSVMIASLVSFYMGIPFAHVEAGLRSGKLRDPFPEELNRMVAGIVADIHFAPTARSKRALLSEQVAESKILVSGNTVIDALYLVKNMATDFSWPRNANNRLILVTAHRRESFGEPFRNMLRALKTIAERNSDVELVYPVHPNPSVRKLAQEVLGDCDRVYLCDPLNYDEFIAAMNKAYLIVTDSGGVQEEAPALSTPVLVMRNETERHEAVEAGVAKLVGTDFDVIVENIEMLLNDPAAYQRMASGASPYGDGLASKRIVNHLASFWGFETKNNIEEFGGAEL